MFRLNCRWITAQLIHPVYAITLPQVVLGHLKESQREPKHRPESHLTCFPSSSSQAHFFSLLKKCLVPVQSLQQVSLYAEPVKSLSDVSDQLSHAALLTQRLHHRVQLLEELCRRVEKGHSWLLYLLLLVLNRDT